MNLSVGQSMCVCDERMPQDDQNILDKISNAAGKCQIASVTSRHVY